LGRRVKAKGKEWEQKEGMEESDDKLQSTVDFESRRGAMLVAW